MEDRQFLSGRDSRAVRCALFPALVIDLASSDLLPELPRAGTDAQACVPGAQSGQGYDAGKAILSVRDSCNSAVAQPLAPPNEAPVARQSHQKRRQLKPKTICRGQQG